MVTSRLRDAVNAHDLDAITGCFTPDYVNETPVHPSRGFRGGEQVRKNWAMLLGAFPDLVATILRSARDGDVEWSEWKMLGTRANGSIQELAGVLIFTVRDDRIASARFYLEPVDKSASTVDDAVRAAATGQP